MNVLGMKILVMDNLLAIIQLALSLVYVTMATKEMEQIAKV